MSATTAESVGVIKASLMYGQFIPVVNNATMSEVASKLGLQPLVQMKKMRAVFEVLMGSLRKREDF